MEPAIFKLESQAKEKLQNSLERGHSYREDDNYNEKEALDNYLDALEFFAQYRRCYEGASKLRNTDAGGTGNINFNPIPLLFDTFRLLDFIQFVLICFDEIDETTEIYISEKLCLIIEELAKYQKDFTVEEIKEYKKFSSRMKNLTSSVEKHQEILNAIKKIKPEKTENQTLKRIRIALKEISKTESCPINLEKTGGCFIATAAYMTDVHPDLDTFRNFRDQKLLNHPFGKFLVSIYYQISPSIAAYIEKKPKLRELIRHKLTYIAQWLRRH
jgi:hypothetical protein